MIHLLITAKLLKIHAATPSKTANTQSSGKHEYCVSMGYCTEHIVHFLIQSNLFVAVNQHCHRISSLLVKFRAVTPAVCSGLLHDIQNISCNCLAIDCFYNGVFLCTCPPPMSLPYSQDRDTNSVVTDYYTISESLIKSLQTQLSFVSIKP